MMDIKEISDRLNCRCIQNEVERLEEEYDTDVVYCDWLYLGFGYRPYRISDGELSKVWKYVGKDFDYCPFCGKKYKPKRRK